MNYYDILEIDKNASSSQIKDAFRTLAKKHHPDKNQSSASSEAKFKEINEAYEVLSNVEKKNQYDIKIKVQGSSFRQQRTTKETPYTYNPFGNSSNGRQYPNDAWESIFAKWADFAESHYNSDNFGENYTPPQKPKPIPLNRQVSLKLTLKELREGVIKKITYERKVYCDRCNDSNYECSQCGYDGYYIVSKTIQVKIPSDSFIGSKIIFSKLGNHLTENSSPGDLHILIEDFIMDGEFDYEKDDIFSQSFNRPIYNTVTNVQIKSIEVLLGENIRVDTPQGSVDLNIGPLEIIQNKGKIILQGKGISYESVTTAHILNFKIEPLSTEELAIAKSIKQEFDNQTKSNTSSNNKKA